MSDGETIEEAITNGRGALRDCIEVFRESGESYQNPASKPLNGASVCLGPSTQS